VAAGCTADPGAQVANRARQLGADSGIADAGAKAPAVCNAACFARSPQLCAKDTSTKLCVECTADTHCTGSPFALGSTCDKTHKLCLCKTSADCAGKRTGTRCIQDLPTAMCGCQTDGDCAAPARCVGKLNGARVCKAPCTADKACTDPLAPRCDKASGRCVACTADAHCPGPFAPRCSSTLGRCVACTQHTQCTSAGKKRCDASTGSCAECAADADCPGSSGDGNRCVRSTLGILQCRCKSDSDCAGNANGPTCDLTTGRCSCAGDKDCKAPASMCVQPFIDATYKQCSKKCALKADCGLGLNCLKPSGRCGECQTDAACASTAYKLCDAGRFKCVACKADKDCSGKTPLCDTTRGACVACKTDAQCAGSDTGGRCVAGACSCATDQDCVSKNSWGSKCVTYGGLKRCGCAASADCAGNTNGPTCFTTVSKCSCTDKSQCKAPKNRCNLAYPGSKYKACRAPCKSDADCLAPMAGRCDKTTGGCVECVTSAHCANKPWEKVCHGTRKRCVECVNSSHCTAATLGKTCKNSLCGCASHADCAGNSHGTRCDPTYKACNCDKDTDCPTGKKCKKSDLGSKIYLCK